MNTNNTSFFKKLTILRTTMVLLSLLLSSVVIADDSSDIWVQTEIRDSSPVGTSGFLHASRVKASEYSMSISNLNATCIETDLGWSCYPTEKSGLDAVNKKESKDSKGSYEVAGTIKLVPKSAPERLKPFKATISAGETAIIELATDVAESLVLRITAVK